LRRVILPERGIYLDLSSRGLAVSCETPPTCDKKGNDPGKYNAYIPGYIEALSPRLHTDVRPILEDNETTNYATANDGKQQRDDSERRPQRPFAQSAPRLT